MRGVFKLKVVYIELDPLLQVFQTLNSNPCRILDNAYVSMTPDVDSDLSKA